MKKSIPLSVKAAEQSPAPDLSFPFQHRRTWIMGVLNATPDSFYAASRDIRRRRCSSAWPATWFTQGPTSWISAANRHGPDPRKSLPTESWTGSFRSSMPFMTAGPSCRFPSIRKKAMSPGKPLAHGAGLINDISRSAS